MTWSRADVIAWARTNRDLGHPVETLVQPAGPYPGEWVTVCVGCGAPIGRGASLCETCRQRVYTASSGDPMGFNEGSDVFVYETEMGPTWLDLERSTVPSLDGKGPR